MATGRRLGLELKLVAAMLVIALVPLLVSAILIDRIAAVAQNFASNRVEAMRPHLENAAASHAMAIEASKALYQQTAQWIVADIEREPEGTLPRRALQRNPELVGLVLEQPGRDPQRLSRQAPPGHDKEHTLTFELSGGRRLQATFAADPLPAEALRELRTVLDTSRQADTVRSTLPSGYRWAFLILVGGVVVVVTATGILLARRMIRRIDTLVSATARVALGDLEARVELDGRDELTELAASFNKMVEDLLAERQKSMYLQRINAWQDVARRLAHEIKNPLTPIQLAVQQCVSKYEGDDERFRKLLGDCDEIVGEEIENLRRLVDAFSMLGRLPRVDARPLPLSTVLGDLQNDPMFERMIVVESDDDPELRADRLLLRRLLANLVENGMQAGQEAGGAGRVQVSWTRSGDRVVVAVDDEGPGVPEEDRERIFEPYVTSKETGTGLGLAICKKIALDHGGSLQLEKGRGGLGGARFTVELPAAVDPPAE